MADSKDSGTHQKMCQSFHAPPDRTSDYSDRENTPTGDDYQMSSSPMPGAHPVAPVVAAKPKPVAMIVAKSKQPSREGSPDIIDVEKHEAERNNDGYKSPVKSLEGFKYPLATNGSLKRRTSEHIYDTPQTGTPRTVSNYVNYPPMSGHQVLTGPVSPLHVSTQFSYSYQQSNSPRNSQQNSPGGRAKKAPPPPPKRNASLRQNESTTNKNGPVSPSHNVTTSASPGMTSVLSPPPIQQKPQISTPQAQAFVNCVQSLSERFGKKSEENSAGDNLSSDNEDLPPAPLVAMEIIEPKISNYGLLGKSDKISSGEYMLQQRLKRESSSSSSPTSNGVESAFGVKLRQAKTESQSQNQSGESIVTVNQTEAVVSQDSVQDKNGVNVQNAQNCVQQTENTNVTKESNGQVNDKDKQRKDSTGSGKGELHLSSSTSSLDSNTLPFANENVGTIKQRAQQCKPSLVMILDDGTTHTEEDTTEQTFSDNTDTIKRTPNKLPKPQQQTVQKLQQPKVLPKPNQQGNNQLQQQPQSMSQQQDNQQEQQKTEQDRLAAQQQKLLANQQHKPQQQYNASVTASFVPGAQSSPQNTSKGKGCEYVSFIFCKLIFLLKMAFKIFSVFDGTT
jgi:hypothetical protein